MAFPICGRSSRWRRLALLAAGIGLLAAAPTVGAVTFSINSAVVAEGGGYGKGGSEKKSDALGVKFGTAVFPESFSLDEIGAVHTFKIGSVQFLEPKAHDGVTGTEVDDLEVRWTFQFAHPAAGVETIATKASVREGSDIDYLLDWTPRIVNFGNGGEFLISLHDLQVNAKAPVAQLATITLLSLPAVPELSDQVPDESLSVPEPGSLVLLLGGLAGVVATRRRRPPA